MVMWVTVYFKSGRIVETIIYCFGDLDIYRKEDIIKIKMGCRDD